jgi:mRNA interferase RelE/StbE
MCMRIRYTKQAIKYLLKLQAKKVAKIRETIKQIAGGDTEGLNIVYMKNLDVYRVRVGDIRVIYEIQDDELLLIVIKVGSRGDVYK